MNYSNTVSSYPRTATQDAVDLFTEYQNQDYIPFALTYTFNRHLSGAQWKNIALPAIQQHYSKHILRNLLGNHPEKNREMMPRLSCWPDMGQKPKNERAKELFEWRHAHACIAIHPLTLKRWNSFVADGSAREAWRTMPHMGEMLGRDFYAVSRVSGEWKRAEGCEPSPCNPLSGWLEYATSWCRKTRADVSEVGLLLPYGA